VWLGELAGTARALDRPGDAVALYVEAGEISTAESLAVEHARALLAAGRHDALDAFLTELPSIIDARRGALADVRAELFVARGRPADAVELLEEAMHHESADTGDDG